MSGPLGTRATGSEPAALAEAPRCGARTRAGTPCRAPAVRGRPRCRMHGGNLGGGAPRGNTNALKHGFYSAEAIAERKRLRALIRALEWSLGAME